MEVLVGVCEVLEVGCGLVEEVGEVGGLVEEVD